MAPLLQALNANRKRNRTRQRRRPAGAFVNMGSVMVGHQTKSMTHSNTDRLLHITLAAGTPPGTFIYRQNITPSIIPRLTDFANQYQKIVYEELHFEVQTQTGTGVSGGYVVGFSNDPSLEIPSGQQGLVQLTALQGSKTSKNWDSVTFRAPVNKCPYYCAPGSEVRLYSPGTFYVLSDGPPNMDVTMTVTLRWKARLYDPAIQNPIDQYPQLTVLSTGLRVESGTHRIHAVNQDLSGVYTRVFLDKALGGIPNPDKLSQPIFYRLPYPAPLISSPSGSSPVQLQSCQFVRLSYDTSVPEGEDRYILDTMESAYGNGFITSHDNLEHPFFWQGDNLTPINQGEYLGTAASRGFYRASPHPSVNGVSMISKRFQSIPLTALSQLSI